MTTTHLQTKLEIKKWDEHPFHELPDGQKVARATTTLAGAEPGLAAEATMSSLLHYRADGTSTFVGLLSIEGQLGDRAGSLVLRTTGTFDGTHARMELTIVPGSGTGELAGIQGGGTSVSAHSDYPYMPLTLDYQFG